MTTTPQSADPAPSAVERDPARLFAPPRVERESRADGSVVLRSPVPLGPFDRCTGVWLERRAAADPNRTWIAERGRSGQWMRVSYAAALAQVKAIGTWLLDAGLGPTRPLAVLSDNSLEHALLMQGAMHVGVPVAPVSVAYSLMSADHAKLGAIVDTLRPGAIFAASAGQFAPALRAIASRHDAVLVAGDGADAPADLGPVTSFAQLLTKTDDERVARAFAAVVERRRRSGGPLAVVTHGLVLRAILDHHAGRTGAAPIPHRLANTSVSILSAESPWAIELVNCTRHLDAASRDDGRGAFGV